MSKNSIKLEVKKTEIFLREDGIIQINASDACYGMEDIKIIQKKIGELSPTKALVLLLASPFTTIDSEARHFLSTPEAGNYSIAEAYVIKSLAQRLILNFLTKVTGTPIPVKFFTEVDAAIAWLNTFKR